MASALAPLATYATTLAVFGLPHVIAELAYIRARFGHWLGAWWIGLVASLAVVPGARIAALTGFLDVDLARTLELLAGVAMIAVVAPIWWSSGTRSSIAGLGLSALLLGGLLWSPLHALLAVAVLHNWTPLALVSEAAGPALRTHVWTVGLLIFVGAPVLVGSGVVSAGFELIAVTPTEASPIGAGSLARNLGAYLPPEMHGWGSAANVFSAIVVAQCLHYAAVLLVLPRLGGRLQLRWVVATAGVTAVLLLAYLIDFRAARALYGVAASLHAWVEVPILVLCMLPAGDRGPPNRPQR